ncbi:GTPase activating factor [Sparganum proliferum]
MLSCFSDVGARRHHSKKKWKLLYGQLDREHSIITLISDEKRKPESLDLTRCDYVPIHPMMLDKPYCFGLLLYGATAADREEVLYFAVEPPQSSSPSSNFQSSSLLFSSSSSRLSNSGSSTNPSTSSCSGLSLDPQAYAGRPLDSSVAQPDFASGFLRPSGFSDFSYLSSKSLAPSGSTCGLYNTNTPSPLELAYWRWVKALAFHCRNTCQDSDIDADPDRRRSEIRCFRTLEVKLTNAKLLPRPLSARPEGTLFSVSIDGLDIARAYSGTHGQVITFEEFPDGFSNVRVSCREEKKKRTEVLVTIDLQAAGDGPRNCLLPGGRAADSAEQAARSAVVPICNICEAISPQATLTYRKLFVLPFQYYDQLRKVIATQLETELVPVCMYMWDVLSSDQNHFLSSLLLATIESKTHLELIVNLLRAEISPEQPASAFRSNTLGQQLLDLYMNMVCSEWRQNCFRRVFEEASQENFANFALQHQLNLTASSSSLTGLASAPVSTTTTATGPGTSVTSTASSRAAKFSTSHSASLSSEIGCESSSSSGGGCGGFAVSSSLDPPRQSAVGSLYSIETSSLSQQSSQSFAPACTTPQIRIEWYRSIIKLLIDDMLKYAPDFPLQLRWIYAEIQQCPLLQSTNTVLCNLVFLRGLCPSLSMRSDGSLAQDTRADCLKAVAKTLITLTSQKPLESILPPDLFKSYRSLLCEKFAAHVTSPLSPEELKQLNRLYIEETVRASTRSMSRELAQLAGYFQIALLPELAVGTQTIPTILNRAQIQAIVPPKAPMLRETLLELGHIALQHIESSQRSAGPPPDAGQSALGAAGAAAGHHPTSAGSGWPASRLRSGRGRQSAFNS